MLTSHFQTRVALVSNSLPALVMSEYISWAFCHTRSFACISVFNTGLVIDLDLVVLIGNRSCRACFDTHLATNTTDLTYRFDILTQIFGRTRHPDSSFERLYLYNIFRTGLDADTTAYTFVRIDNGEILHHLYRAERACVGTLAKADTGILAS